MKLTHDDIRMVQRLRKRQRQFRRWRYPLVIVHGLCVVTAFVLLIKLSQFPGDGEDITVKLIVLTYSLPAIFVLLALSSVVLGQTLSNWRGDPKTELLLSVVEELQNKVEDGPNKSPEPTRTAVTPRADEGKTK